MLIAIDAGHGLTTPGKRCMKRIDPNETREWVLNARIAERVEDLLRAYDIDFLRVDDPSGAQDIPLLERVRNANQSMCDLYLSIHHNAGIEGKSGGGIMVFSAPGASEQSRIVRDAIYRHTVATTGLKGNRSNPTPESNFYVLTHTQCVSVLGEFVFMDSKKDTPLILTDEYANQVAQGIVNALAEVYKWEEREMNENVLRRIIREEFEQMMSEKGVLPPADWAKDKWEKGKNLGLTDGSRPQAYITRQETITMLLKSRE